jgi:anti-anti-sigma factor
MSVDPVDQEIVADGPLFLSRHRYGRDVLVVSLAGELDRSNVESARALVAETGPDELLVVDLSSLEFIDSAGIALLVSLAELGGDGSGVRVVPSAAPAVARVMRLTGVESMVRIASDRTARVA